MGMIGKTLRFVGGLAVGAGIGAAAAMLLAPQSGEQSAERIQSRVQEILAAGQRASRSREDELYAAWEAELSEGQADKRPARHVQSAEDAERDREKARATAQRSEDAARREAQKELEQAREEAQRHLDKASAALDKAEKPDKS